ncbi:MAG: alcohol dehydrogenase [Candidatus Solibacter sp.]|nr:alcohol dehydrogenase [Candidatus Solibacter sp.]
MRFDITTNQRIVFGRGVAAEAAGAVRSLGGRVFLVTGRVAERFEWIERAAAPAAVCRVNGEPTIEQARRAAAAAKQAGCDVVAACGGGSALDLGKAVAALAVNAGDVMDYIEVVGKGEAIPCPALPMVAIPTTAGTGSEATRNAVLQDETKKVKASIRHQSMVPAIALIDPDLTLTAPADVTAATGLDALTQLIEPFVSSRANAMTDALGAEGIRLAAEALPRLFRDGADAEARAMMSWASLLSGICLANAGLGAVHGLAAPVGAMYGAPHGAVCAAMLPHVMAANRAALPGGHAARWRYGLIDGWVDAGELVRRSGVPGLRAWGAREEDFEAIAAKAAQALSMKANPVALPVETLVEILRLSL